LESDINNPSNRYFVLRDLLGLPDDDPEICQSREEIMTLGPIPIILDAQHPDGY
jgi:hypothetical protein